MSNKCPHLGLSMQGKTALLSAKVTPDCCVVCPAHNTAFSMETGEVKGEWCPGFPDLPFVGKLTPQKNLPVFPCRVNGDAVEVDV